MQLRVNGETIDFDPRDGIEIVLDVDEGGETLGPVRLIARGGPLRVEGNPEYANAVRIDWVGLRHSDFVTHTGVSGCLIGLSAGGPLLSFVGYSDPDLDKRYIHGRLAN